MAHVFLYGPPGAGKSTVGRQLAHNLKRSFVDLDRLIEKNAGMSIAQIIEGQGEAAFRDLESAALRETVSDESGGAARVIALGGGALLREENRRLVERSGAVVVLTAEAETLLGRIQDEPHRRPLLAGDLKPKLTSLLESRAGHYNSFPMQVHVDRRTIEQVADQVQRVSGRYHLSAMGEYDVIVGKLESLTNLPLQHPVLVTDEHVARLHGERMLEALRSAGYSPQVVTVPAGETYKNLETVQQVWNSFLECGMDRRSTVIAMGGGMLSDLAGFAAATYMRGIQWVCVPTTLLAMVDASLGGKTGIDLPQGKNLIGAFHPPKLVLADPALLQTLPEAEFIAGMAEVVKHGVIADRELFDVCARGLGCVREDLDGVVKRAIAVKVRIIEDDPYEQGVRAALNLGHTVGHAVELASGLALRHGEAVAIGMAVEAQFAVRIGVARRGLHTEIASALAGLGLPVEIPPDISRDAILQAMQVDKKKNAARIRFALPADIGSVELVDVSDLHRVLEGS